MSSRRLPFDPGDPYPLLPYGSFSHAEAVAHAEEADRWLGLRALGIEETLAQAARARGHSTAPTGEGHWIGLPVNSLLTPYLELRQMLAELAPEPGEAVVDLGAGYGRMAFVLDRHHSGARFLGYEIVPERVQEGANAFERLGLARATLEVADITAQGFALPAARAYFLYDFGSRAAIEALLAKLQERARREPVTVIGRGRATRDAIERGQPWLSEMVPPRHLGNFSIYRSAVRA